MSELELNIFFNQMVDFVRDFRKLLEDEEFLR
jgi:hypothetical protein